MSTEESKLRDEALGMLEDFVSHPAKLDIEIREALTNNDYTRLYELVRVGRIEQFRMYYTPDESLAQ